MIVLVRVLVVISMVMVFDGGDGDGGCDGELTRGPAKYFRLWATHVACPLAFRCGGTDTRTESAWMLDNQLST